MSIKDKIICSMPKNIRFLKIIAPIFNKIKNFPIIERIINWYGFATQREMPVVQNQSELKVIYKSQSKSDKKVILFADTFNINFEVKNEKF